MANQRSLLLAHPSSFFRLLFVVLTILIALTTRAVSYLDLACPLLASLYTYFFTKFAFPPLTHSKPPTMFPGNTLLRKYVTVAAWIGLFLPLAYITAGYYYVHHHSSTALLPTTAAAVPHTFLLACQILTEQLAFRLDSVSLPVQAFVPIFYNTRRLFSIADWLRAYFGTEAAVVSPNPWLYFGRILSVANLILWSYNLFGFLLPVFLPRAFRRYYEAERALKASAE